MLGTAGIVVEVITFFALTGGLAFTVYEVRRLAQQSSEDTAQQSSQHYEVSILAPTSPVNDTADLSPCSQTIVLPAIARRGPTSAGRNGWLIEFPVHHMVPGVLLEAEYFVIQVQRIDQFERRS